MPEQAHTRSAELRRLGVLAARLLRRDVFSGHLLIMLTATIIAVASTVSVNLLVTRVEQVLISQASALLAGDLAIASNDPPPARYRELAAQLGLQSATTATLRSVVTVDERLQLVRLKAVDDQYPLRGELQIATRPGAPSVSSKHGPAPGEIWADAKLFQLLDLAPGAKISVGQIELKLAKVLVLEPDRADDLFSLAPLVLMHSNDLAATGLVVPGSRISYTSLFAGSAKAIAQYRKTIEVRKGDHLSDPRTARPEMRTTFLQAERFLALAAFSGVLLALIGVALAAHSYSEHHVLTVAVLKTLGLSRHQMLALLSFELGLLALVAAALGNLLALAMHRALLVTLVPELDGAADTVTLVPLLHGLMIAVVTLAGFALPALASLSRMPVIAVLARDHVAFRPPSLSGASIGLTAVIAIAPWHLGNVRLVSYALGGMLVAALVLAGVALLLVRLLGRMRARTRVSWRFGLANIARRARVSVLQTTAVGLGIAVVLLLGLVQNDLARQWTAQVPPDAPNHFLINIQADERDAMAQFLADNSIRAAALYPMVRGRLTAINGKVVNLDDYREARARRLADREFNLSAATRMKADNRLIAGQWWAADTSTAELSVEEGITETLGLALGDELEFTVAGQAIRGRITNLRQVDWDNFEVNFFVVTTPMMLSGQPTTYISSFHVAPDQLKMLAALVKRFPSVTVIDVDALLRQVRSVMERVSAALLWVFVYALGAGALVLAAAVHASQRERMLDTVLLKTLGASAGFVLRTMVIEFALLGLLAGAVGTLGALGIGWGLAKWVLDIPYEPSWLIPVAGVASGALGVTLLGMIMVRRALRLGVLHGLSDSL